MLHTVCQQPTRIGIHVQDIHIYSMVQQGKRTSIFFQFWCYIQWQLEWVFERPRYELHLNKILPKIRCSQLTYNYHHDYSTVATLPLPLLLLCFVNTVHTCGVKTEIINRNKERENKDKVQLSRHSPCFLSWARLQWCRSGCQRWRHRHTHTAHSAVPGSGSSVSLTHINWHRHVNNGPTITHTQQLQVAVILSV